MERQKIFISSVQGEFQNERKLIADYIRQDVLLSIYFEPFLFEELPAQDKSAQIAYLEQAAKSEIYLLLIGKQYGYQDEEGISPTEREYDTATTNHAYRIAFIKSVSSREEKEDAFKRKITTMLSVMYSIRMRNCKVEFMPLWWSTWYLISCFDKVPLTLPSI